MTATSTATLPRWDLSNVYPGLESAEFQAAVAELRASLDDFDRFLDEHHISGGPAADGQTGATLAPVLAGALDRANALLRLYGTLRAYVQAFVATDSYNTVAKRLLSELQMQGVRWQQQSVRLEAWIGAHAEYLPASLAADATVRAHAFFLQETAEQSRYLMSEGEEGLAAELGLSGVQAWSKLQTTVCSQIVVPFERDGRTENLPLAALQNLGHDPDPAVRQRAYDAELAALHAAREPLAACLNGVKGAVNTLSRRRGRRDALHTALDQARIDTTTLDAMLGAMWDSFPAFRRYFKKKAQRLGRAALPWFDLQAPVGRSERSYTFPEAEALIVDQFGRFSPRLAAFARRAFAGRWVDAEPRAGKRGGAFCMSVPRVDESRVLLNFDGSLDQVFTLAHELGHGFHNDCMVGKTELQTVTPMTLAETASIFCETIITDAALAAAADPEEELAILETALIGAAAVIVDIASRYLFEKEVFERRVRAELSADDFCDIMLRAQAETYGDGLDPNFRHAYMWTWKPHYYRPELSYYNFPYAFGLLFGTGLYAIYQERGAAFVPDYEALLASTGEGTAADLAGRFGLDLRQRAFWEASLKVIEKRIDRYCAL